MIELIDKFRALHEIKYSKNQRYDASALDLHEEGVLWLRQLTAGVYAKSGTVSHELLTPEGTLSDEIDPYWRRSIYYGVSDMYDQDRIHPVIGSRLVLPDERGVESLQIHIDELNPMTQLELRLADPSTIAEFAGYIKDPKRLNRQESTVAMFYLFRAMIKDSERRGIKTWVFGLRPQLQPRYEKLFGSALERAGDIVHVGSFKADCIPYKVDIETSLERLESSSLLRIGSRAIAAFFRATENGPEGARSNYTSARNISAAKHAHIH